MKQSPRPPRMSFASVIPSLRFVIVFFCLAFLIIPISVSTQTNIIDSMIASMTLEQKVGQMFMVNLYGLSLTQEGYEWLQIWQPGGMILFPSNAGTPEQVTQLTNSFQQAAIDATGIPLFIATDQEGGQIARLTDGFTQWPLPMVLTAANDSELAYRVGQGMARELRAVGVSLNLAPVADLRTNLDNIVIGRRSPGSDPVMVGLTLAGLVRGMQDNGVMTAVKHFPGHGDTNQDSHLTLPYLPYGPERLFTVELPAFLSAINAGSGSVMVAHIWFTDYDPDAPLPATLSANIVTGLLRDSLGYDGLVMTDALDMDAVSLLFSRGEAAVMAIQAGTDLITVGPRIGEENLTEMIQYVLATVRSGAISETRIEESVRRILNAKERFGVLGWMPLDVVATRSRMDGPANQLLVNEIYRAGVTLVYDTDDSIPIHPAEQITIVFPGDIEELLSACGDYNGAITWLPVLDEPTDREIAAAVNLSARVNKIVVFTREAYGTTRQQMLVNALPEGKTIVVALGSPYDWRRFPQITAYMATYDSLTPALTTACGILYGSFPSLGRLPVSLAEELPVGSSAQN